MPTLFREITRITDPPPSPLLRRSATDHAQTPVSFVIHRITQKVLGFFLKRESGCVVVCRYNSIAVYTLEV